ncbi:MAG: hypothetical protein HY324_03135 [Chlamydiia bacterium]|nr:hypothetical protein [Chlamydiia bacterium]
MSTLDLFRNLDCKLGFPHQAFRSIHIAGTNGKGSCAWKMARALMAEGYRVGLYTSPHISSFTERIQVDGKNIPVFEAEKLLQEISQVAEGDLSFFGFLTALAFHYFRLCQVDWAVIEVGLGGRLDPTNVITPQLSVITSIGYDHKEILGTTLEEIAKEKGGIIKENVPLLVGPTAAPFFPWATSVPFVQNPFYDAENTEIARKGLEMLGVSKKAIDIGIAVRPPCRFEKIGDAILDVAHNPDGFQKLKNALEFHFPGEVFHFIVGFSKGKEWEICLKMIEPIAAKISFVDQHPRLIFFGGKGIEDVIQESTAKKVICGSFYLMQDWIQRTEGEREGRLIHR